MMQEPFSPEMAREQDVRLLQDNWAWLFALGVGLMILGMAAAIYAAVATITAVELFGVALLLGSGVELVSGVRTREAGGFILHVLIAVLYLVAGMVLIEHPGVAALALTLVLAAMFMVGGLFRIVVALVERFPGRGWVLCNGVITLLLGIFIWRRWPFSGLWVIGLFVGIELIFLGVSWVMLGVAGRMLRRPA